MSTGRKQSPAEEIFNVVTHGLGSVLSIAALIFLLLRAIPRRDALVIAGASVFGTSLIFLYGSSTIFHSIKKERVKNVFRTVDLCAIFALIAGTYTPLVLMLPREKGGIIILCTIWLLALAGMVLNIFFQEFFDRFSFIYYLLLGWMAVFIIKPILSHVPLECVALLVAGGLCYSVGVYFLKNKKKFMHTVWHLLVLAGSAFHYCAVVKAVFYTAAQQ